ncbi:GtrA family protein [Sphingomonas sp. PWP1-2]|uniref:GtrA family protein n=1 Tax=Sphingomonas sp. PWP1-2 TaxID=2804558 RepID=UPI003CEC6755
MAQQFRDAGPRVIWQTIRWQPLRYLAGGAFCALVHNVIVISATQCGIAYPVALILSFCVTTPIGYLIHSAFTFEQARSWIRLQRFMLTAIMGFLGSTLLMVLLCTGLRVPVIVATPVTTVLLFLWNFTSARWAILQGR